MWRIACVLVGYALGCVLFGDIIARIVARTSIFKLGNGNPGMANVARTIGAGPGLACLAGDILKVVAAALICRALFPGQEAPLVRGWAGLGATLGHNYPLWNRLRGGKGVATLSSMLVLLNWSGSLVGAVAAAAALAITGYLSIAAVAAAAAFAVWAALRLSSEALVLSVLALALALAGQWSNLRGIEDGSSKRDIPRKHPASRGDKSTP